MKPMSCDDQSANYLDNYVIFSFVSPQIAKDESASSSFEGFRSLHSDLSFSSRLNPLFRIVRIIQMIFFNPLGTRWRASSTFEGQQNMFRTEESAKNAVNFRELAFGIFFQRKEQFLQKAAHSKLFGVGAILTIFLSVHSVRQQNLKLQERAQKFQRCNKHAWAMTRFESTAIDGFFRCI